MSPTARSLFALSLVFNVGMLCVVAKLSVTVASLSEQVAALQHPVTAAAPAPALVTVPVIAVSPAAPPIKVAVPTPRPKPTDVAAVPKAKHVVKVVKPSKLKVHRHYRAPGRVITCDEIPWGTDQYTTPQIRSYMYVHGATPTQVRQVLHCIGR